MENMWETKKKSKFIIQVIKFEEMLNKNFTQEKRGYVKHKNVEMVGIYVEWVEWWETWNLCLWIDQNKF